MEISLDVPFVLGVLAEERELALREIRDLGVVRAYENSRDRHDARIAAAPDVGTLACRAGCTWCCHFSVDVRAVEVFSILEFVERTLSSEEKARVFSEVRANALKLEGMDDFERMRHNVKCPFLLSGRCSIYAARPQTCRNYHATAVAGCQASFEDPDNLDIDPEFAPMVYQAGGAHVDAFSRAMREAGYDTDVYELNSALAAALSDPHALDRLEARSPPFAKLNGDDVPGEFEDL
ncbi:YkgJ family cysteine cluster protein [Steroidobacter sp. S1-65]|uniref:YkgJ family cysteine cluster protein n=1 Tax=Steroidobacter gossypii TaxID=2805490 RepID=A0ABS1X1G8_9GAMM|nr:YkgJ family cysteine cluster protein [Steroidobacter gossypii]MBM0107086.1 YkgJ family cysteine cluster protein [Steroidobacter gossypii]